MRILFLLATSLPISSIALALDGGPLRLEPRNGWRAFEIISVGDDPTGDGFDYSMPSAFDGIGAWRPDDETLRVLVNHERTDASISEVSIDLGQLQQAIANTIDAGTPGGVSFVTSARQAYDRWSDDAGGTWQPAASVADTAFSRFCSGQSYLPNTFGVGRGFVDHVYVTGEEAFADSSLNRLFALDITNRDFYQLSDVVGSAAGGIGGLLRDSFENAALVDTGETQHVALLLSPDGGSETMTLYVGEKGKDTAGTASDSFLARNGLAYGSYYYLDGSLPSEGTFAGGSFDTTPADGLKSSKLEDVDTSPSNPSRVVLGDQTSGVFTFDFQLDFTTGSFDADASSFAVTMTHPHADEMDGQLGDADNVDWTDGTRLGTSDYPDGLIFVNEDSGRQTGEVWMSTPDGGSATLIADTAGNRLATESTGVLDVSRLVGYRPGSLLLVNNQGTQTSMTLLIHPDATPVVEGDFNGDGTVNLADYTLWRDHLSAFGEYSIHNAGDGLAGVDPGDFALWKTQFGSSTQPLPLGSTVVPEPTAVVLGGGVLVAIMSIERRRKARRSARRVQWGLAMPGRMKVVNAKVVGSAAGVQIFSLCEPFLPPQSQ